MRFYKFLAVCMLAFIVSSSVGFGQVATPGFTPPAVNIPWNNYIASRINDGYNTIIGLSGTYLVPNTASTYGGGPSYPFYLTNNNGGNIGFPFNFIGVDYSTVQVGVEGTIYFNQANYAGSYGWGYGTYVPYLQYQAPTWIPTWYSYEDRVLMVYWTDLNSSISSPQGGVYYRVDNDPAKPGKRIMKFEWRVQGSYYPSGNPGNFQAYLYEDPPGKIEMFYGPNSISRTKLAANVFGYGAQVGIKNTGQISTYGPGQPPSGNDAEKFLIMLAPQQIPDTVAITRVATFDAAITTPSWTYFPDVYSYYRSYIAPVTYYRGSPYFHYDFPTTPDGSTRIGYRILPVNDDVATDSVWFTPTRAANVYPGGSSITVNARFLNVGRVARLNVPVEAKIYRDQDQVNAVATLNAIAFTTSTPQFQKSTVVMGTITPPLTDITGIYTVKVYPQLAIDQDAGDDTLRGTFFISKPNDIAAWAILQPYSNTPPLNYQYPVGVGVPIEARFLNIGFNTQQDVPVGYNIYDASGAIVYHDESVIPGTWAPSTFRDINMTPWVPTAPGKFTIRIFALLANDDSRANDTVPNYKTGGKPFDVNYEIELLALPALAVAEHSPRENQSYPDGKPIQVRTGYLNNGIADATNVPANVKITDPNGNIVYDRTITILTLIAGGFPYTTRIGEFPDFVPNGSGRYCLTTTVTDAQDPIVSNNTATWCFNVKARYAGTMRVGFGERFRTIREAWDSVSNYGVSGPLRLELVDDQFTVQPTNNDPSQPSLDMRGRVVGLSANNPIVWAPVAGKTNVRIDLNTPSGIGIWYGQKDTSNPSGYITWDGGTNKAFQFVLNNTTAVGTAGYHNLSVPFYFGQGSSNYTVKNSRIEPLNATQARLTSVTLTVPTYNQSFNQFNYVDDLAQAISSGILLRNSPPINTVTGTNSLRRDTLRNQNNVFDGNIIHDFGYGIASIGAGPLYVVGQGAYVEYANQNNKYMNNTIYNLGRAGIVMVYEKNSEVTANNIRNVNNAQVTKGLTTPNAAGISATSGGNVGVAGLVNRGYSSDLTIQRNTIADVTAATGIAAGIAIETSENVFISPANRTYRFPAAGASNMKVWNNMVSNVSGASNSIGIAMSVEAATRIDYINTGNKIDNNSIYNATSTGVGYGVLMQRSGGTVQNDIIAVTGTNNPVGLVISLPDSKNTIVSDYNVFWVPNGFVGSLSNLSKEGYTLPSPPVAKTLNQWRYLSGQDQHSMSGNVVGEFVSTTPGTVNLHIKPSVVGSLANNRGVKIAGMTNDIDNQPRGAASVNGRYDIGADEFTGATRNNDVMAEDILGPIGYGTLGTYGADPNLGYVEYMMVDTAVDLNGRLRNVGGMPNASNIAKLIVQRWTGTTFVTMNTFTKTSKIDVSEQTNIPFGKFMPQTLREVGQNDPYYGFNSNVTPIYRLRLQSGTDDNIQNNTYDKLIRFYVLRSNPRKVLVSVEGYNATNPNNTALTGVGLGNKLNADTLLTAFKNIGWSRSDGIGTEDYDIFERDKWPQENLNFAPWKTLVWAQGAEPEGMTPYERVAVKQQLNSRTTYDRSNLIIAGQDLARIHDVALTAANGSVADQDFVRNYLRSQYSKPTVPANYSGLRIQGVAIEPLKYELVNKTSVAIDAPPTPAILKVTVTSDGVAKTAWQYKDLPPPIDPSVRQDSSAGVVSTGVKKNVLYVGIDWRHFGRFFAEAAKSGAQRVLLTGLDYFNAYRGVLPVKLVSFDASQTGREAVSVEWKTESELNVASMVIERAEVGRNETGESVGEFTVVDSKSSTSKGSEYRVVDQGVKAGSEYEYRLVTVDVDGTRTVEQSARVKLSGVATSGYTMSVQPNPVRDRAEVIYRMVEEKSVRIVLYDAAGKQVSVLFEGTAVAGESKVAVDASTLSSGVYTVRLEAEGGVELLQKLNVQK